MENDGLKKAEAFKVDEYIEYIPNSIATKTIIKRITGSISAISSDSGGVLVGKVLAFDNFIEFIEGSAEIMIDNQSNLLEAGQSIIIPANSRSTISAIKRFKLLSTIIKSGYEDVS